LIRLDFRLIALKPISDFTARLHGGMHEGKKILPISMHIGLFSSFFNI